MNDLTVLYYSSNRISDFFADNVRNHLLEALPLNTPIISITHRPIKFGFNICVGDVGISAWNIYYQIYLGAKEATTKYVTCCEDDSLYVPEHFDYRPKDDEFAYNVNRGNVNKKEYFFRRNRPGMCMCIAPTKLMIDTLELRMQKYPREQYSKDVKIKYYGEPGRYEQELGLPFVKRVHFKTNIPSLTFNHRPSYGGVRAPLKTDLVSKEIPYWGKAEDLWRRIHG